MLTLVFNGERIERERPCSLAELLETRALPAQPFAVALNGAFIPRGRYTQTALREGDRVELVIAGQGG